MKSYHDIEAFLRYTPSELREIVLELRNLVAAAAPNATEDIRHGGLSYYFKEKGGPVSAGICGIALKQGHVRLFFPHGAFIPDPKGLLRGSSLAMRYIRLTAFQEVSWDDIYQLMVEHAAFDPHTLVIK